MGLDSDVTISKIFKKTIISFSCKKGNIVNQGKTVGIRQLYDIKEHNSHIFKMYTILGLL